MFDQSYAENARIRANSTEFRLMWARHFLPGFEHVFRNLDRVWRDVGQIWPRFEQVVPDPMYVYVRVCPTSFHVFAMWVNKHFFGQAWAK